MSHLSSVPTSRIVNSWVRAKLGAAGFGTPYYDAVVNSIGVEHKCRPPLSLGCKANFRRTVRRDPSLCFFSCCDVHAWKFLGTGDSCASCLTWKPIHRHFFRDAPCSYDDPEVVRNLLYRVHAPEGHLTVTYSHWPFRRAKLLSCM